MPISIDWGTGVITVPQSYLTFISGTLYELDTDQFRLDLKALEAGVGNRSAPGMAHLDTHSHNTEVTIAGTTLARVVEITNGYTVTFADGQYAVRLVGSNNNVFDEGIINRNQVSIIPTNSAGLITVSSAAAVVAAAVWDRDLTLHTTTDSAGVALRKTFNYVKGIFGMKA